MDKPHGIVVLGDVASTLLTQYGGGKDPHTTAYQHRARDLCVPGGAAFTASVVQRLLVDQEIQVHGAYPLHRLPLTPTRRTQLIELHHYRSASGTALRATRSSFLDLTGAKEADLQQLPAKSDIKRVATVVVDHAGPFRTPGLITDRFQQDLLAEQLEFVRLHASACSHPARNTIPTLFVSTPHSLPTPGHVAQDSLWGILETDRELARMTALVTSISVLRRHGLQISRRLSWEKSVEDLLFGLSQSQTFAHLQHIGHVLVRFGIASVAHIDRFSTDNKPKVTLYFDPTAAKGIYRDSTTDGDIIAKNSILIGCCLRHYSSAGKGLTLDDAIRDSIVLSQSLFQSGIALAEKPSGDDLPIDMVFPKIRELVGDQQSREERRRIGITRVSENDLQSGSWQILEHAISLASKPPSRVNLASAIVRFGHENVLNVTDHQPFVRSTLERPTYKRWEEHELLAVDEQRNRGQLEEPVSCPIFTPVMTFGKLTVVDRSDMESLRTVLNLFAQYVSSPLERPLSIAVFGTPGSGKSFAVKQLLKSIDPDEHRTSVIEFNVAQLQSIRDLESAVSRIRDVNISRRIPLVFFDEFDAKHGDNELGWLKMFLALMQDGKFRGVTETVSVGASIFVFAGGTESTFAAFTSRLTGADKSGKKNSYDKKVIGAKLPDFISRLRGHLDIVPLDAPQGKPTPVIRRSLVLRSILLPRFSAQGGLGREILIDDDVLYAFLLARTYRHGVRSMEAIVDMSTPIGGALLKASLPPIAQLSMHVDSAQFLALMKRSSSRPLCT